jgi:hypothetical protein
MAEKDGNGAETWYACFGKKENQVGSITVINDTISVLSQLTKALPIGTNLALLHFLWMLVSGALLPNRGAIFPALQAIGLSDGAIRRAWRAFRSGKWHIAILLDGWRDYVHGLPGWTVHRYEGYVPVTVDVTAFWRPALKTCPSKHYHPAAQRALPAVIMGLVGDVGELHGQRLALPRTIARVHPKDPSEKRLWYDLLHQVQKDLGDDEIAAVDAGVKIQALQAAGVVRYVVRLAINFTARRNVLPEHTRGRKPTYGRLVRPLPRQRKGKTVAATPPDERYSWVEQERELRVEIWRNLVLNSVKPDPSNLTFDVYAFYDPAFKHPWLLATPVVLQPPSVYGIYTDRWPVEQLPLSAKQMVGAHRQFVHHPASVQRLPELALLAGSILSFLAATCPVSSTGFWDRHPKRTPGRLPRTLIGHPFPKVTPFPGQLREKHSATTHLPKGAAAHQSHAA